MEDEDTSIKYVYQTTGHQPGLDAINSVCDPITYNPSDSTNNRVVCKSQHISNETRSLCSDKSNGHKVFIDTYETNAEQKQISIIDAYETNAEQKNPKPTWSTSASKSDMICLGATLIIVIIQLSVLVFYLFKDKETEDT